MPLGRILRPVAWHPPDASPRVSARRAGIVAPEILPAPPDRLPQTAGFADSDPNSAFWRTPNSLCMGSGSRILADLYTETGSPRRAYWSIPLLQAISRMARDRGIPETDLATMQDDSSPGPSRDWLRIALWLTYHSLEYPAQWRAVELPLQVQVPRWGADLPPAGTDRVRCTTGDRGDGRPDDPFRRASIELPGIDITSTPDRSSSPPSTSSSGWMVAALAALAALLFGGRS